MSKEGNFYVEFNEEGDDIFKIDKETRWEMLRIEEFKHAVKNIKVNFVFAWVGFLFDPRDDLVRNFFEFIVYFVEEVIAG